MNRHGPCISGLHINHIHKSLRADYQGRELLHFTCDMKMVDQVLTKQGQIIIQIKQQRNATRTRKRINKQIQQR